VKMFSQKLDWNQLPPAGESCKAISYSVVREHKAKRFGAKLIKFK